MLLPQPRYLKPASGEALLVQTPVRTRKSDAIKPQGYKLEITPSEIIATAADDAGHFYARQTLGQLRERFGEKAPAMTVEDWPDFAVRGFMLDISRDKVPTMQSLREMIDLLASLKINQLQLYTEHTFAYRDHETVWRDASPMTAEEIRQLDLYCRERFIDLVPNQNSFGHLERWLKHPAYARLAECPDGFTFPWGTRLDSGFSLNPLDPRSIEFVESLYDELLPNFTSSLFNVGCDETFDLGMGRSKEEVRARGRERVYLEFLNKIHKAVKARGKRMMFWGDIILHKPQYIGELPDDLIALNWGYDAEHPFEQEGAAFRDAGVPYYICPGTSSWCSITGRSANALANLRRAAEVGLNQGALGYLITDWGDYGHLQYWPVSYLGIAAGAAYSWCLQSNRDLDIPEALSRHIFRDLTGTMGRAAFDLGNVYRATEPLGNGTRLFWTLINCPYHVKQYESVTLEQYRTAERMLDEAASSIASQRMNRGDATLVADEWRNAAAMLRHACRRGQWLRGAKHLSAAELAAELSAVIKEHRRLWLARNRPGGLADSAARLERVRRTYDA